MAGTLEPVKKRDVREGWLGMSNAKTQETTGLGLTSFIEGTPTAEILLDLQQTRAPPLSKKRTRNGVTLAANLRDELQRSPSDHARRPLPFGSHI